MATVTLDLMRELIHNYRKIYREYPAYITISMADHRSLFHEYQVKNTVNAALGKTGFTIQIEGTKVISSPDIENGTIIYSIPKQ